MITALQNEFVQNWIRLRGNFSHSKKKKMNYARLGELQLLLLEVKFFILVYSFINS